MGGIAKIILVLVVNLQLQSFVHGKGVCKPERNLTSNLVCTGFTQFPININGSQKILNLTLASGNNKIPKLRDGDLGLATLTSLETLIMSNCSIQEIEAEAFRFKNSLITFLDLSDNLLTELDVMVFHSLKHLVDLRLTNNPIRSFPGSSGFPGKELRHLGLSGCKLTSIQKHLFKNLHNLKRLELHENQLTTIDWTVFKPLWNLKFVAFARNPWKCDCKVGFLLDYFKSKNISLMYMEETSCSKIVSNPNNKFKLGRDSWQKLNNLELFCPANISRLDKIVPRKNRNGTIEELTLKCKFSGVPQPKVEWLFNRTVVLKQQSSNAIGIKIEQISILKIHDKDKNSHFYSEYEENITIREPPHGNLNFSCRVFNNFGSDIKNISVFNRPSTPAEFTKSAIPGKKGPLLFGFSLWLVAAFCAVVVGLIVVPVLVVVIYFKRKERRKRMLLRVLSAGVIREIQNDRESFEGSVKSYPVFSPLSQLEPELESGYSESDEDHEMELRIQRKSIPTNSLKTTVL